MSIGRLRSLGTKLRYSRSLSGPLSSGTTRTICSSTSFSLILKESSPISKPLLPHHLQLLPQGCAGIRPLSNGRRFDDGVRYGRRTAINWGIRIVPEQEACVIERLGKFHKVLNSGLHFLIPLIDSVAYMHNLKEEVIRIPNQTAVTTDNVSLQIDGVLFVKIDDPIKASYAVGDPIFAVIQLAQTIMRTTIGKMTLDDTFKERATLNASIMESIKEAAGTWGLVCHRYDILDITPPPGVRANMERPAEAERDKRATIVEAEGQRQAIILASEAAKLDVINRAEGEAQAIRAKAVASAEAINTLAEALRGHGGKDAANLKVAEQYVQAFSKLAQESTTVLLPSSVSDPSSMVTQALTLYKKLFTVSDKALHEHDKPQLVEAVPEDASTKDIKGYDALTSGAVDTDASKRPVFSLQGSRKDDE
ncbi:hypothetical protein Dimus_028121 [Dionaea muscipula]